LRNIHIFINNVYICHHQTVITMQNNYIRIRLTDSLKEAAFKQAADRGLTVSELLRKWIEKNQS
jgi:predicted DNA binding CopG/RHH family protein